MPDIQASNRLEFAELFGEFFFKAILNVGGNKSTAYLCLAEWWRAVEAEGEVKHA